MQWYQVMDVRHVRGVISIDQQPLKVPLFETKPRACGIGDLKRRELNGEFTAWSGERFMRPGHEFKAGDQVEVVTGPLTGIVSKVSEINENSAKLIISMLGSERTIEVGMEVLEAA